MPWFMPVTCKAAATHKHASGSHLDRLGQVCCLWAWCIKWCKSNSCGVDAALWMNPVHSAEHCPCRWLSPNHDDCVNCVGKDTTKKFLKKKDARGGWKHKVIDAKSVFSFFTPPRMPTDGHLSDADESALEEVRCLLFPVL
jgi:hypothetical protein